MKKYLLLLLGLSFLLSEIILKISPTIGFIIYSILITGCFIFLSREKSLDNYGKLMTVMMILPIIRIAELFIQFDYFWRSFIAYYLLFFLVVFYSLKFKINPGYTKKGLFLLPLVILAAAFFGFMGNAAFDFQKYWGLIFLLPVIAFSEEVLFRGMIQNLTKKHYGSFLSVLFPSLLYAIFSISFGLPAVLFLFFVSLVISLIYHYTKNIYLTIAFNFIIHFFILVLPKISS